MKKEIKIISIVLVVIIGIVIYVTISKVEKNINLIEEVKVIPVEKTQAEKHEEECLKFPSGCKE